MNTEALAQAITEHLFGEDAINVYAILDGASVPDLLQNLATHQPDYECLYRGELKPDLAHVAPYLVCLERDADFTNWVIEKGWGQHWGIFVVTDADLRALRRHFRTFLIVYDPDGKPIYFRYYDPRVLRTYLPTCTAEELKTMFGPVASYMLEDEAPANLRRFQLTSGALQQQTKPLAQES